MFEYGKVLKYLRLLFDNMNESKVEISLKFKVKPTSEGFLAQCVEIPAIIVESPNEAELDKDLNASAKCYFQSFPEQASMFILQNQETIEKVNITI